MPYIPTEHREQWIDCFQMVPDFRTSGELNYALTCLCLMYVENTPMRYCDFNEVVGVLECVKQEFYRRAVIPYEDKKMIENGDVYNG